MGFCGLFVVGQINGFPALKVAALAIVPALEGFWPAFSPQSCDLVVIQTYEGKPRRCGRCRAEEEERVTMKVRGSLTEDVQGREKVFVPRCNFPTPFLPQAGKFRRAAGKT